MSTEKSFNNWALKKWSLIFSAQTRFDPCSYLLTSLVPLSYIKIHQGGKYAVVDLEELKTHTALALQGCKFLVSEGCAQWIEFTENPKDGSSKIEDNSRGILAIGKVKGFNSIAYFMEELLPENQEEFVETMREQVSDSFADSIQDIDTLFISYNEYCAKAGLSGKASQIYRMIKNLINKSRASKLNRVEFLEYLYCINTVVYDLSDVPKVDKKHKELATANQIVMKLSSEELIQIVPYFVQNFHKFARKGAEETSIYNLSFNLTTILTKMRGGRGKATKISDNDTL